MSTPAESRIAWRYDPWREDPRRALAAFAAAVLCCALVVAQRESAWLGVGLSLFVIAAFAPAIAPRACAIDAAGAEVRGPLGIARRRWTDVRRIDDIPAGVLLSPHAAATALDAARALLLPMPRAERDSLRAGVRHRWQAARA